MTRHTGKLAWLIAALFLLVYEAWALATGGETLSHAMYAMTQAWGLLPFLLGVVVGGLAVHFWWRWDPEKGRGNL
jgi:hypothetical protein